MNIKTICLISITITIVFCGINYYQYTEEKRSIMQLQELDNKANRMENSLIECIENCGYMFGIFYEDLVNCETSCFEDYPAGELIQQLPKGYYQYK